MNSAHLHLIFNHLPIIGYIIGVLLIACTMACRGNRGMFWASVLVFLFAGAGTLAAYFTGEPAEEVVESIKDVPETLIERHEDAAKLATLLSAIFTGLTIAVIIVAFRKEGNISLASMLILLAAGLLVCAAMVRVGNLGGQIRHTEIREPVSTACVSTHTSAFTS